MARITRRGTMLAAAAVLAGTGRAAAQAWPSRPVRIIVPLVPGGTTDAIARVIAEPLSRAVGQPVVVENRPGANGWIANDYVMRERPDGHTLIANNVSTFAINSAAPPPDRQLTPARGLVPIAHLGETPQAIVVPGNSPATSLADFIARARAAANAPLVYASAGVGSYQHIDMELFARRAGIQLTHLPLRGAGEMVTATLRGDAQIAEFNVITAQQHLQTGRLRALAVVSRERLPQLPDVPTTAEVGFPEMTTALWNGLFAPAGTPQPILEALHGHVLRILRDPEITGGLERAGTRLRPNETQAAFAAYVEHEVARWTALVRELGITIG
ncbi:Bug family tripartite tricarboxylate transporter substrate binding protein [Falsiroseomonas oryzae]|uniref:Bug family tripartite tricarboxylate transporter substrate binding protein n=1 Tax=Falsiroseomonas oryzae TaxID=2766473 RepID=UPI0022EB378D|nr:tripartite tricarboxylate transporter substrate binding protein [Roseomonas sp. MO-31]